MLNFTLNDQPYELKKKDFVFLDFPTATFITSEGESLKLYGNVGEIGEEDIYRNLKQLLTVICLSTGYRTVFGGFSFNFE